MDLRQLRYFVAIVEAGSFSRAALDLHVAQPALSLHVRNMETDLGTELLVRTPQGIQPTQAGQRLFESAKDILGQVETARRSVMRADNEPAGDVRLGLPGTIGQHLAVPLILAARERYPRIRLCVAEAMSGFVLDWLRQERVDLALLYGAVDEHGLTSEKLLEEELCLLGPAGEIGGAQAPVSNDRATLAEAATLPLILPSSGHGLRTVIEATFAEAGLSAGTVIDVDSYASIAELVHHGLGYAILPATALAEDTTAGRLRSWRLGEPQLTRSVHLAEPYDRPASQAALAIRRLCREVAADLVTRERWRASLAH